MATAEVTDLFANSTKLDPKLWAVVKRCAALLDEQKIQYVLMGTAALAAHGIKPKDVPDIDFLVAKRPEVEWSFAHRDGSGKGCALLVPFTEYELEGDTIKVDFVAVDNPIESGFLQMHAVELDGVKVMSVDSALGIKRWKGRPKDVEFLKMVEDAQTPKQAPAAAKFVEFPSY